MASTNKLPWLKIIGWGIIIHIILIVLSILEVLIYSMLIEPGLEQLAYEQHAEVSAPYISILFGIILFFLIAQLLGKKQFNERVKISLYLAIVYILLDVLILFISETNWLEQFWIFIVSFSTKILASYFGAKTLKEEN